MARASLRKAEILALGERSLEKFDGHLGVFTERLGLIDFTETTCTESMQQAIVADNRSAPILGRDHLPCSLLLQYTSRDTLAIPIQSSSSVDEAKRLVK
jgi:hypothetical protein